MTLPATAFRSERPWNLVARWIDKHATIKKLVKFAASYLKVGSVRSSGTGGQPIIDVRYGGNRNGEDDDDFHDFDKESAVMEQHGFAGGVRVGMRAAVFRQGMIRTRTLAFGVRDPKERPTFLEDGEVCMYAPTQQRAYCRADGSFTIEAGIADYKTDGSDLDEGSKVRLAKAGEIGELEIYAETSVLARSQAAGGAGPAASVFLEADGTLTLTGDGDGVLAVITLAPDGTLTIETDSNTSIQSGADVSVTATGAVDVEAGGIAEIRNADGATIRLDGADAIVLPGAGGKIKLASDVDVELAKVAIAPLVEAEFDARATIFNAHVHPVLAFGNSGVPAATYSAASTMGSPDVLATSP
jgi:phage gp45-like